MRYVTWSVLGIREVHEMTAQSRYPAYICLALAAAAILAALHGCAHAEAQMPKRVFDKFHCDGPRATKPNDCDTR